MQNQQLYPIKQLIITSNLPTTNKSLENKTSTKDELSNIEKSIPNPSIPIEASNDSFVALMTALLGSDSTMRGGPYRLLQQLRVWQTPLSKNSLTSLVEVIRNGGEEVQLLSLELLNCGLEPIDVSSLGGSLSRGFNTSLTQLKLDFNINLGSEGMDA